MCLLIVADRFPDEEVLKRACSKNGDGIGLAFINKKEELEYHKGLTMEQLMNYSNVTGHVMIHFRIATVGDKVPELTHPFPITPKVELSLDGKAPAVLGHNGNVSNWREMMLPAVSYKNPLPPGKHWSDTRGVTFMVHTYGPDIIDFLGSGSRFAILGTKEYWESVGEKNKKDLFRRFGSWIEYEKGIYFSNSICIERNTSSSSNTSTFTSRHNATYYDGYDWTEDDDKRYESWHKANANGGSSNKGGVPFCGGGTVGVGMHSSTSSVVTDIRSEVKAITTSKGKEEEQKKEESKRYFRFRERSWAEFCVRMEK